MLFSQKKSFPSCVVVHIEFRFALRVFLYNKTVIHVFEHAQTKIIPRKNVMVLSNFGRAGNKRFFLSYS